jgi:hypothetical protein
MKKSLRTGSVISALLLTFGLYLTFYSRIESKPTDAGFWFILALGMAIGVALTRFFQWMASKKQENK